MVYVSMAAGNKCFSKPITITLIIVSVLSLCIINIQPVLALSEDDFWCSKMSMREARGGLGVAVVNGKIYAIGGYNGSGAYLTSNEEYDPAADTWTLKTPLPVPMAYFGTAVYQDKIYCISSENGITQVYDPLTDTWHTKASLPNPREGITAVAIDDKIYVVGGISNMTDVYDPATDMWTTKAPLPVTPDLNWGWSCTTTIFDNEIHLIGALPFSNSHQIYNPPTNAWRLGTPLTSGYWFASAGATTGEYSSKQIYVFGGDRRWWPNGEINFTCQRYDPKSDNWTTFTSMPTGRLNAAVAIVNDRVYVIGGFIPWLGDNWSASAVNEQYTPVGYVIPAPSLPVSPNFSSSPTASPPASPSDSKSTDSPPPTTFRAEFFYITIGVAIIGIILAVALVLKRKHIR
jgi:hypothetical protein